MPKIITLFFHALTKSSRFLWISLKWSVRLLFLLLLAMLAVDMFVSWKVQDRLYESVEQLPKRSQGVVLGTAKYYATGSPNLYYKYRIEATALLMNQQKIERVLVSGDNKTPYYNEPKMMTNDLRRAGVALSQIQPDYAGYNTLDSVIRAKQVYHLEQVTFISQGFHCERALFIAQFYDLDAICFAAKYPEGHYKVRLREIFARSAMLVNLLIGYQPETLAKLPANTKSSN